MIAGLMIGTSYVPFPPWAVVFCYIPLMFVINDSSTTITSSWWNGWWAQFFLSLIGFHWIYHVATEFGHLPAPVAVVIVLLFASMAHLYVPLACALTFWLKNKFYLNRIQTGFVFALVLSLSERAWPAIFDWNFGYTLLWIKSPAAQWADVIGFEGLASLLFLTQAALFSFWVQWREQKKSRRAAYFVFAVVFTWGFLHFAGNAHKTPWTKTDGHITVAPIQANIGNLEKIQSELGSGYEYSVIQRHFELMTKAQESKQNIDLFLWPETAFPDFLDEKYLQYNRQQFLLQQLRNYSSSILLGGYSRQTFPPLKPGQKPQIKNYNALFLLNEKQNLMATYRKTQLLIFGEYIPFSDTFPVLLDWFPFIAGFGRGSGPTVIPFTPATRPSETVRLGAQICYEGLSPTFSRQLSEKGAQVLLNLTNDSWFGTPFEPNQHMIMTLARAIEIRRPLIRSTNTGISTVIHADGTRDEQSPLHQPWTRLFEVRYQKNPEQTHFVQYGHLNWILLCLGVFALIATARNAKKQKGQ